MNSKESVQLKMNSTDFCQLNMHRHYRFTVVTFFQSSLVNGNMKQQVKENFSCQFWRSYDFTYSYDFT